MGTRTLSGPAPLPTGTAGCIFFIPPFVFLIRMSDTDCLIINPMEEQDDALVRAVTGRDPRLLNELIERYQYRLYRYLLCLVRNRETAGDLFQETWLRVLERGRQYKPRFRFEAWLFTIARNLVFDLMRRRKTVNPEHLEDSGLSAHGIAARESPSPLDSLTSLEEDQRVNNALDRLPALVREALLLRYQEDLALEEIARIVSAPLPTVKSRIYRGLDALRSQLGKE
jgi:RNA polymerase sigma-70 factor (ECF subfamily)